MADSVVSDGVSKTVLSPGSGPEVKKGNTITVHCTGILAESNKKFWRFGNLLLLVQYLIYANFMDILQKWVPYSQRYLVLGLVGLVRLVGLGLPLL